MRFGRVLVCAAEIESMMARGGVWAAAAAAVWWMAAGAEAVWLEIAPAGSKCVSEEIQSNVIVIGDYSVLYEHHHAHPTVSVKVTIVWVGSGLIGALQCGW